MQFHQSACIYMALVCVVNFGLVGCSSGGNNTGGGNTGASSVSSASGNTNTNSNNNQAAQQGSSRCTETTIQAWAVSDAGNTGYAEHLAAPCDKFEYEANVTEALLQWDVMWQTLTAPRTWTNPSNPLYTYSFYEDYGSSTNFGRAYRHTGFDISVGSIGTPMAIVGPGIYTNAKGVEYQAMVLRTWDSSYWEMFIFEDERNFAHLNQHTNGYPVISHYQY